MAKKRRKPAPRNTHTPPDQYDFIQHCAKLLKARVAAGAYHDRPGLEASITDFDPAIALIEIAADATNTPETRAAVSAKLMPYWHKEQSLLVKEAGGQIAPTQIVIQVAAWASGRPSAPALPAPAIDVTDFTANDPDAVRTGRSTPSPELSDRDRLRAAAMNAQVTEVVEVSPRPDVPRRVVAEVSARRGRVSMEERLRRGGFLGNGEPPRPDTSVITDDKIFGR